MFKEGSLYRVIEIPAHIRVHPGIKSKELPERLEVSTRTIYRVVEPQGSGNKHLRKP